MQSLSSLNIGSNKLTGTLPSQWAAESGQWQNLTSLDVHFNQLEGTIPASWANWTAFDRLSL